MKPLSVVGEIQSVSGSPLECPHIITNLNGHVVSAAEVQDLEGHPCLDLKNGNGKKIGTIQCRTQDLKTFQASFHSDSEEFSQLQALREKERLVIFGADMDSVLYSAAKEGLSLDQLLYKACLSLRSFLIVENCSIFGLPDGYTLAGLMAVTPYGIKNSASEWNYSSMNLAKLVIEEKKGYVCHDPKQDPNFKENSNIGQLKNMVCWPILTRGEMIGLVNVCNKLDGDFSDEDLRAIQKFCGVIAHLIREEFERKRSEQFKNTNTNLGKYLSSNLVREIESTGSATGLGGAIRKVVVLFADIRSFTTITEGLDPDVLVNLLNFYFEEMSAVIQKYNGTLDKLVGDLMMVLWNIPHEQAEAEVLALRAALEMQKTVAKRVAQKWMEQGVDQFGVGIGINSGPAVAGNIGSTHFRNYTAIGTTINTAQRIEALAKAGEIWVHDSMYSAVEGKVPQPVRREINLRLKGLSEVTSAYVFRAP